MSSSSSSSRILVEEEEEKDENVEELSRSLSGWFVSGMDEESEDEVKSDSDDSVELDLEELKLDEKSEVDENSLRVGSLNVGQALEKKLHSILSCATRLQLDVFGLQEVGEPLNYARMALDFGYQMFVSEAKVGGVAIVVRESMVPFIRKVSRYEGRLVGLVVQCDGRSMLLVSVYMPSGLDHVTSTDPKINVADNLYAQILKWKGEVDQCILLGDFNETRSALDRTGVAGSGRWLNQLHAAGMVDVFRHLHPDKSGYTHFTHGVGGIKVKSRLDYIWVGGMDASDLIKCSVWDNFNVSHHRMVYGEVKLKVVLQVKVPRVVLRLPNLRTATDSQKLSMAMQFGVALEEMKEELVELGSGDERQMNELADRLSSMVYKAAASNMKLTGGVGGRAESARLQLRRQMLAQLRSAHARGDVDRSQKLLSSLSKKSGVTLPRVEHPDFVRQLQSARVESKRLIRNAHKRLKQAQISRWNVNRKAAIHQMLNQERPTQVISLVDPITNQLEVDPDKLKCMLRDGFSKVFDCIDETEVGPNPPWFDEVYEKPKSKVNPTWYSNLMSPTDDEEVLRLCSSCKYIVAPGQDKVTAGLWRICVELNESVRWALTLLFNACLRLHKIPRSGKRSIIVPILKKPMGDKVMSNVRPISLQNSLTKLLTKLLASRLGSILAEHRILHPAQEGFLKGGASFKCIDSILDVWEDSRETKSGCYNLFYDIKAAYDSVRKSDLLRSLKRINLPRSFVNLVDDSLTGLTSCVRTVYGVTADFDVRKSLRQGDPLSPLLFIIFIDALHVGLECNPLYGGARDGYVMKSAKVTVASEGFADDTTAISGSQMGLYRQNHWVHEFAAFNHLDLHPDKTQLVGRDESTGACMVNNDIVVAGKLVQPVQLDECITYLGVQMCMELDWTKQVKSVTASIGWYTHVALKNKLSITQAVYFFNIYLMAKIEYGLRFAQATREQTSHWDKMVVACICNLAGLARKMHTSAAALVLGLELPSQREAVVKVSEAFLRLNDGTGDWSASARGRWSKDLLGVTRPSRSRTNRLVYVNALAQVLGWSMQVVPSLEGRRSAWRSSALVPTGIVGRTLRVDEKVTQLVFGYHGSFGSGLVSQDVTVFTDGSASLPPLLMAPDAKSLSPTSSWGVCYANDWFKQSYHTVPPEDQLSRNDLRGAVLVGDVIPHRFSVGIYMAELHAVVRALMSLPVTWNVTMVLDSKSSIEAVTKYLQQHVTARVKLRMSGRPMLGLVSRLVKDRQENGGSVTWVHVKSHSDRMDQNAVGNRCADFIAGTSRSNATEPVFDALRLELGERWLYVTRDDDSVVYDDLRRSGLARAKEVNLDLWKASPSQCAFADVSVLDLCSQMLSDVDVSDDRVLVKCLMLTTSNTLQYFWNISAAVGEKVQQRCCSACGVGVLLDVHHVLTCPAKVSEHAAWCTSVIECLKPHVSESTIARVLSIVSWRELLVSLFGACSDLTLCRLMFGGFSDLEAYQMLSRLRVLRRSVKTLTLELRKQMFVQFCVLWKSMC